VTGVGMNGCCCYHADGAPQMIEEQAAWCPTCQRVVAAEHLRPLSELEREPAELHRGQRPDVQLVMHAGHPR
jgi:hypothetical protein